jgi:hypothetical protein
MQARKTTAAAKLRLLAIIPAPSIFVLNRYFDEPQQKQLDAKRLLRQTSLQFFRKMTTKFYVFSVQCEYDIAICFDAHRNAIAQLHEKAADMAKTKMP